MTFEYYFIFVFIILTVYIVIGNYIYFSKVLPSLGKSPSFMPSGQFKDVQKHVSQLKERKEYPWYFQILNNIQVITIVIFLLILPIFLKIFGIL
jgi:hypothetical protein